VKEGAIFGQSFQHVTAVRGTSNKPLPRKSGTTGSTRE